VIKGLEDAITAKVRDLKGKSDEVLKLGASSSALRHENKSLH